MIIPIRCYAVMAGTHAADPLGVELLRATTSEAAAKITAAIQLQARTGAVLGGAQYFVRDVDADLDLPVGAPAEAVALGYTVRVTAGDSALVISTRGAAPDRLVAVPPAVAVPSFAVGTPPVVARGLPVGGAR